MAWWKWVLIYLVVWLGFAGGFFFATATENWDAGDWNYDTKVHQ